MTCTLQIEEAAVHFVGLAVDSYVRGLGTTTQVKPSINQLKTITVRVLETTFKRWQDYAIGLWGKTRRKK